MAHAHNDRTCGSGGNTADSARLKVLEAVIRSQPYLTVALDRNFRFLAFNDSCKEEFKRFYNADIAIGARMRDVLAHVPAEREKVLEIWDRALTGERFTVVREYGDPAGGIHGYYEIVSHPVQDERGGIIAAVQTARDVTGKIRTEQALRESEEKFRQLSEFSPAAVLMYRGDRQLYVNKAAVTIFGYTKEELLAMNFFELVHPDSREMIRERVRARMEKGYAKPSRYEVKVLTKSGGEKWLDVFSNLIHYEGKPTGITNCMDITERKQAEEALRASEARLNAFFEYAPGVLLALTDDNLCYINTDREATPASFGLTRETIKGRCLKELFPDFYRSYGALLQRVISTGAPSLNIAIKIPIPSVPGERKDWRASYFRVPFGKDKWGLGIVGLEITDIKKAEETLRRNEYELRTLVDNSPDIIFRLNRQLQYVFVNPAYQRLTGLEKTHLLGSTNEQLGMPREMVDFWRSAAQEVIAGGRQHEVEFHMTGFFGKRYFFARLIPEFESTGLVETVLVIARDITERKRAEERVRYISFHDEVTGLFNRAFFEEELRRVDTGRDMPVSIIMGDVNNLKLTNDVFGHEEGDRLLRAVTGAIRNACRQNDIVARWGGDEFTVILPCTGLSTAEEICARIGQLVAEAGGTVLQPSIAIGAAVKERRDQNIYQVIRRAEEKMYDNKLSCGRENQEKVLSSLLERTREKKEDYLPHITRSLALAEAFGRELGLSEEQRKDLYRCIELHDIGDTVVPAEILRKAGRLNDEEWAVVRKHAETGYRIAKTYAETARISNEIFSHGEYWDGSGYPRGLKGSDIPYLARIFLIIDAYDVMTHPRPYAPTLTAEEAVEELHRNAGKQFDPDLTAVFITRVLARIREPAGGKAW